MMQILNTALIGFGHSACYFHKPLLESLPGFQLNTIVTSQQERAVSSTPSATVVNTPEKAFNQPEIDLVIICTPTATHFELAKQALKAKKHVVVEKPVTVLSNEAHQLATLAKEQNRSISVFQNRRWDGDFLTITKLIKEKTLGDIHLFENNFDLYRPSVNTQRWRDHAQSGGGFLYDLGSHLIDQTLTLFGPPQRLFADIAKQREHAITDDYFHLTLIYPLMRAHLSASALATTPRARFSVFGTQGSYIKHGKDPQEKALKQHISPCISSWGYDERINDGLLIDHNQKEKTIETERGNYVEYYTQLYQHLIHQGNTPVPLKAGYQTIQLIEAAQQSAQLGCTIDLEHVQSMHQW